MSTYIGSISNFLATEAKGAFLPTHETYISPARDEILVVTHLESLDELDELRDAAAGVSNRDDFLVLLTAPHGETTRHVQLFRNGGMVVDASLAYVQFRTAVDSWLAGEELLKVID